MDHAANRHPDAVSGLGAFGRCIYTDVDDGLMLVMAKETLYEERYRHAAPGRMVGRRNVLSVCVPILGVFVPGGQGLGDTGRRHGPARY
jgi:hypothetical protein